MQGKELRKMLNFSKTGFNSWKWKKRR